MAEGVGLEFMGQEKTEPCRPVPHPVRDLGGFHRQQVARIPTEIDREFVCTLAEDARQIL
jgi:hypothetical protein